MKIKLKKDRNIFPIKCKAGDMVEVTDSIAKRWIANGIAELIPEVKPVKTVKNIKKKGK